MSARSRARPWFRQFESLDDLHALAERAECDRARQRDADAEAFWNEYWSPERLDKYNAQLRARGLHEFVVSKVGDEARAEADAFWAAAQTEFEKALRSLYSS